MHLFWIILVSFELTDARLLDMSYTVDEESRRWVTTPKFNKTTLVYGYQPNGAWVESYFVALPEHMSTHLDAPSHFAHDKNTVEQIPIDDLVASAVVVDMQEKAAVEENAELSTDDLMDWLEEYGPLPDRVVVFVRTGWGAKYYNRTAYIGTDTSDETKLRYPGLSAGAAQLLGSYYKASGRRVVGVGIDTMSIDPGSSKDFLAHQALATENIYLLENVANLEELPVTGAKVTILPIKLKGGSGGPCRILAQIPDSEAASLVTPTIPSLMLLLVSLLFAQSM